MLTSETMKSNLTEAIEKLDDLEKESNLNNTNLRHVYSDLMKKIEHLNNLIAALESIHQLLFRKGGIPLIATTILKE